MSILQRIPTIPESGQFVAVYAHDFKAWAAVYQVGLDGKIYYYDNEHDGFYDTISHEWLESMKPIYYVAA